MRKLKSIIRRYKKQACSAFLCVLVILGISNCSDYSEAEQVNSFYHWTDQAVSCANMQDGVCIDQCQGLYLGQSFDGPCLKVICQPEPENKHNARLEIISTVDVNLCVCSSEFVEKCGECQPPYIEEKVCLYGTLPENCNQEMYNGCVEQICCSKKE